MKAFRAGITASVIAVVGVAGLGHCNLWSSLENCGSDGDCAGIRGATCDPGAHICVVYDNGLGDASDGALQADATPFDGGIDAPVPIGDADAGPVGCDPTMPFGVASLVVGFENQEVFSARPSQDQLTMYYAAQNDPHGVDLMQATRLDLVSPFMPKGVIPNVNEDSDEYWPTLSADRTEIFFESGRFITPVDGGAADDISRIWSATRTIAPFAEFDTPTVQTLFQNEAGAGIDSAPYLEPSGNFLYFGSTARGGLGGLDIFVAASTPGSGVVNGVTNVTAVNSAFEDTIPVVTDDLHRLYFSRADLDNDDSVRNVYVATRTTTHAANDDWLPAVPVRGIDAFDSINTVAFDEFPSYPTADQCRLYFISNRPTPSDPPDSGAGKYHLWVADRPH